MQITATQPGKATRLSGVLDVASAQALREGLAACGPEVDLSGVEECDASALQLLCAARKSAERSGRQLKIVSLSPAIRETGAALGMSVRDLIGDPGAADARESARECARE